MHFLCRQLSNSLLQNGYEVKVNNIKNCMPNGRIQLKNFNFTLDTACNVIIMGCIITKGFTTAKVI